MPGAGAPSQPPEQPGIYGDLSQCFLVGDLEHCTAVHVVPGKLCKIRGVPRSQKNH